MIVLVDKSFRTWVFRRAQVSLEYAAVVAFVLAMSIPLWFFVQDRMSWARADLDASVSESTVSAVTDAANWASLAGYPARTTVDVSLPDTVINYSFAGKEFEVTYNRPGGFAQAYSVSRAYLSGVIPSRGGRFSLLVSADEGAPGNVTVSVVR